VGVSRGLHPLVAGIAAQDRGSIGRPLLPQGLLERSQREYEVLLAVVNGILLHHLRSADDAPLPHGLAKPATARAGPAVWHLDLPTAPHVAADSITEHLPPRAVCKRSTDAVVSKNRQPSGMDRTMIVVETNTRWKYMLVAVALGAAVAVVVTIAVLTSIT
jgi:hypothetical protein